MSDLPLLELRFVRDIPADYLPQDVARTPIRLAEQAAKIAHVVIGGDACNEAFGVIYLDTRNKPQGVCMLSTGGMSASVVRPRDVFSGALLAGAAGVLFFHNHPSGDTAPSREDIQITRQLDDAAKLLGMKVIDHVIIATGPNSDDSGHSSLRERGLM